MRLSEQIAQFKAGRQFTPEVAETMKRGRESIRAGAPCVKRTVTMT